MRRALAGLILSLPLVGCVAAVPIGAAGGGAAAGFFTGLRSADTVLAEDAPVKKALCDTERQSGRELPRAFWVYCDHIPHSIGEAVVSWTLVFQALRVQAPTLAPTEERQGTP